MSTVSAAVKADVQPHSFLHTGDEVLILRRCNKDRTSKNGFVYPSGVGTVVETPTKWWGKGSKPHDLRLGWDSNPNCGGGLHGWPWGLGLGDGQEYDLDDLWLVIGAKPADVVGNIDDGWKCKFRTGIIRYEGNFAGALAMIRDGFHACISAMAAMEVATGQSARNASGEKFSKLAASGDGSQLAASGDGSQLAASGDGSQLAASGKDCIVALVSQNGRVKVGERGAFALPYWSDADGWFFLTGKVGHDGIKAGTYYEVRDGKLVESEVQS